ncbi:MAG: ribonuclease H-like domain-containing protein [Desulfomonilaceae bacterium]|nr:ribonuclease H-like domain-containing protein [Desulfomonilaceae bacterium]
MLRNTFCHIPGIGPKSEANLWKCGIRSWNDVTRHPAGEWPKKNHHLLKPRVYESITRLEHGDSDYFADRLPANEMWRMFPEFRDSTVYLDIETTGMAGSENTITTIATFDGETILYYVKGHNLESFRRDIQRYRVIVTFNGRCFDVPFIERYFGIRMPQAHIDLRFVLKSLGYGGGLKGCEKKLGIDREELDGVDGFFAVLLWQDFQHNHNIRALETLLAYNILDAVNLETLMVMAYNQKLLNTPFAESHRLPLPRPAENLFEADIATVKRIMDIRERYWH